MSTTSRQDDVGNAEHRRAAWLNSIAPSAGRHAGRDAERPPRREPTTLMTVVQTVTASIVWLRDGLRNNPEQGRIRGGPYRAMRHIFDAAGIPQGFHRRGVTRWGRAQSVSRYNRLLRLFGDALRCMGERRMGRLHAGTTSRDQENLQPHRVNDVTTSVAPLSYAPNPRVFVSYEHDTANHTRHVRELCEFLVSVGGIDIELDQWADVHRLNWSAWALRHMPTADFVIVIASMEYKRRSEGTAPAGEGWGSQFEGALLRELITADPVTWERKVLPVLLPGHHVDEIPLFLHPHTATHYRVSDVNEHGAQSLLEVLTGHATHSKPHLALPWRPPTNADERSSGVRKPETP